MSNGEDTNEPEDPGVAGSGITVRELIEVGTVVALEALDHYDDDKKLDVGELIDLIESAAKKFAGVADEETARKLQALASLLGLVGRLV